MNRDLKENYDWSKYKAAPAVRRGNMSMIASMVIRGGSLVSQSSTQRFVWPRELEASNSRVISRRVWGRDK